MAAVVAGRRRGDAQRLAQPARSQHVRPGGRRRHRPGPPGRDHRADGRPRLRTGRQHQPGRDPGRQLRRLHRGRHRGAQGGQPRPRAALRRAPARTPASSPTRSGSWPTPPPGRHFAVYFRDDEVQDTLDDLAISGDLSDTKHDYLGVFTQNAVPSKTDYWQSRTVRSDVRLRPDGSARVALEVEIHNDSAPYAGPGTDPQQGYFTRWATCRSAPSCPAGAEVERGGGRRRADRLHRGRLLRPPVRAAHDRARRRRRGAPCAWSTTSPRPPSATATR